MTLMIVLRKPFTGYSVILCISRSYVVDGTGFESRENWLSIDAPRRSLLSIPADTFSATFSY